MVEPLKELCAAYLQLVRETLPQAACKHPDWQVKLDHCFARIILDHLCGGPWREQLATPAYKNLTGAQLGQALILGKAILNGSADLAALNRQSLVWRGKA